MPEYRTLPLFRWGEELRRRRQARSAMRQRMLAAAAAAGVATGLIGTLVWSPRPLLLWNASASSPIGLYRVGPPRRVLPGDMVVAWAPEADRALAAERGYLPRNVPLVKPVAAAAGDRVCAVGEAVFVNGRLQTLRRYADPSGRMMPMWTGCEQLREGEVFLLAPNVPDAFDGRYFGITRRKEIIGRAMLLWRG
jgi:conjugative transfer signal peptidase TraF